MNSERLKTPKTDYLLKVYEGKEVVSAWIPGLLTLKIQGRVPPQKLPIGALIGEGKIIELVHSPAQYISQLLTFPI